MVDRDEERVIKILERLSTAKPGDIVKISPGDAAAMAKARWWVV